MKSILDKFIPTRTVFRPATVTELFALRLAHKLNDASAVGHYAALAESHSQGQLLHAYRRALRANGHAQLFRRFHVELERMHSNPDQDYPNGLIAIRVERRTIAAAIFNGDHLEYTDARQLSSVRDKALASAIGFISWILARFPASSAALESISNGNEFQRRLLHEAIARALRERLLPIWEIPRTALMEGCGYPALKSRAELRAIAQSIWPILSGTHAKVFIQDAAMLGLHVQTERLFIIN